MTNILELPKLYKKTSTGAIQTWKISVELGDPKARGGAHFSNLSYTPKATDPAVITTVYGLELGKKQVANELITTGKNVGKANETTPFEQAKAEAQSQHEKKMKKGYVLSISDAEQDKVDTNVITGGVDPMLAHSYEKRGKSISYPAFVQPKLDGHRCIAIIQDGTCTLWSRTRKPINSMDHIKFELERLFPTGTVILDGELYNHDYKDRFEQLTSMIKQQTTKPGHEVVQYWVYDLVNNDPFETRTQTLSDMFDGKIANHTLTLPSFPVEDEAEMIKLFGVFIEKEYEGLMVRNSKGLYKGKRSADLQKVKMMQDAEYKIVDVVSGRGKMEGLAIFRCETEDGQEFGAKMKGKLEDLRKYLDNKDEYIGRELTVQFQKFSATGVPIFPVGLRIREDV